MNIIVTEICKTIREAFVNGHFSCAKALSGDVGGSTDSDLQDLARLLLMGEGGTATPNNTSLCTTPLAAANRRYLDNFIIPLVTGGAGCIEESTIEGSSEDLWTSVTVGTLHNGHRFDPTGCFRLYLAQTESTNNCGNVAFQCLTESENVEQHLTKFNVTEPD